MRARAAARAGVLGAPTARASPSADRETLLRAPSPRAAVADQGVRATAVDRSAREKAVDPSVRATAVDHRAPAHPTLCRVGAAGLTDARLAAGHPRATVSVRADLRSSSASARREVRARPAAVDRIRGARRRADRNAADPRPRRNAVRPAERRSARRRGDREDGLPRLDDPHGFLGQECPSVSRDQGCADASPDTHGAGVRASVARRPALPDAPRGRDPDRRECSAVPNSRDRSCGRRAAPRDAPVETPRGGLPGWVCHGVALPPGRRALEARRAPRHGPRRDLRRPARDRPGAAAARLRAHRDGDVSPSSLGRPLRRAEAAADRSDGGSRGLLTAAWVAFDRGSLSGHPIRPGRSPPRPSAADRI